MSMLVKELEEQVGARLFDRTTRSVTLTGAGRRLQPVAERIVAELLALSAVVGSTDAARRAGSKAAMAAVTTSARAAAATIHGSRPFTSKSCAVNTPPAASASGTPMSSPTSD